MLFLAVTLGFLVENQREHYIEHQRAKQYAKSMLEDLEKDAVEILDVIRENKLLLASFDSIGSMIHQGIKNNNVPGCFYYYCNVGTTSPSVTWNDATLIQITQTGSLRYFTNPELVKKISYYFLQTEYVRALNNNDKVFREKSMEIRSRVLNNYYYSRFSSYSTDEWLQMPDSLMNTLLPIQTSDANLLNEFANSFENRKRTIGLVMKRVYPSAIKNGGELIALLKKEYHLK